MSSTGRGFTSVTAVGKLGESTARWDALYAWLGKQVISSRQEAQDNELCTNLDASAGPAYHADALVETRRHMRHTDPTLVKDPKVDRS